MHDLYYKNINTAFEHIRYPADRVLKFPFYPIDVPNFLKPSSDEPKFGVWRDDIKTL